MKNFSFIITTITALLLLTACGFFGPEETVEPADEPRRGSIPTFTPTVAQAADQVGQVQAEVATSTPESPTLVPPTIAPPAEETAQPEVINTAAPEEAVEAAPTAPPAEEPVLTTPKLTVSEQIINIRSGPSTAHALIGAANQGDSFDLTGKNAAGDWWEVCCVDGQPGWIFGPLAQVENADQVSVAQTIPTAPPPPTAAPTTAPAPAEAAPVAEAPAEAPAESPAEEAAPAAQPGTPPDPAASSEGWFDPNAQYHVTNLRVLGLGENNGGIRSSSSLHYILVTVLDENGNPAEGAVLKNLVGDKLDHPTGDKGPGRTEITMFWEPYKLQVVSDASGPVTSQISNQMGLAFPHLPDIVGKLGDENYEYGRCPTLEIRCEWPIQAVHFSYEITFQKMR